MFSWNAYNSKCSSFEILNVKFFLHWQKGFDVFNALDLMENKTFLEKLKFGIGDGNLHYYLYNWRCPGTDSEKVWEVDIPFVNVNRFTKEIPYLLPLGLLSFLVAF